MGYKNIYCDINGDIIDEIFNIPVDPNNTRIDKILREIVGVSPMKKREKIEKPKETKSKKETKTKTKSKNIKMRTIKIRRVK